MDSGARILTEKEYCQVFAAYKVITYKVQYKIKLLTRFLKDCRKFQGLYRSDINGSYLTIYLFINTL